MSAAMSGPEPIDIQSSLQDLDYSRLLSIHLLSHNNNKRK